MMERYTLGPTQIFGHGVPSLLWKGQRSTGPPFITEALSARCHKDVGQDVVISQGDGIGPRSSRHLTLDLSTTRQTGSNNLLATKLLLLAGRSEM